MAKANSKSVYSVSSVFMLILTTDIQNLTDVNHERKRPNQINQINPFPLSRAQASISL